MEHVLEVQKLSKSFGRVTVLHDIDLFVDSAEIVGFIGPNGSGKSTVMKCIMSLIRPSSGTVRIMGHDVVKERSKALSYVAGSIESPGLFPDVSGEENLRLFASLRGVGRQKVEEMIEFVGIGPHIKRKTAQYSMGMKQRLALAIALLGSPKLLLLDEPTNGLDPTAVFDLRKTLQSLVQTQGTSILLSSHQLDEVQKLAHRFIYINQGRVVPMESKLRQTHRYRLEVAEPQRFVSFARENHFVIEETPNPSIWMVDLFDRSIQDLIVLCHNASLEIVEIQQVPITLEDIYKRVFHVGNRS